jgi:predicted SAM-dependent methyltransferase
MDRADVDDLKRQYANVREKIFLPDLIGDATEFPIAPGKLDFIIASHVLEHLPFPLAALRSWYDALAPGGRLLLKVPDKRYTFDRHRMRTPLAHLVSEYGHPELTDWSAHYVDWVENVDRRQPSAQEVIEGAEALKTGKFNIHFHVWTGDDVSDIVEFTREEWGLDWRPRIFWKGRKYRKEVTVLLTRQAKQKQPVAI